MRNCGAAQAVAGVPSRIRPGSGLLQLRNLLDDELWPLNAAVLVDVQPVRETHDATERWPGLVEGDCINGAAATRRTHPQLQVTVADGTLLEQLEVAAPQRLRKTRTPGPRISQRSRKSEPDHIGR